MTGTGPAEAPPAREEQGSAAQQERRRRILDATVTLASEGGFEAVQMRTVAEVAGVALGTLYRYFPSKVHLLVSALARELEQAEADVGGGRLPGRTAHERVMAVLGTATHSMQQDPRLTEALTRAFMFADASVAPEIDRVGTLVRRLLTRAMADPADPADHADHADPEGPGEHEEAIARVIGDVWLSGLVQWVTGRASPDDVGRSLDVAVRLLLR